MAYTTINKSTAHFNTKLYTGNGSTNAITGVGFQPDWVWLKKRNGSAHHQLYDAVRGVTKKIYSSSSNAESTDAYSLTTFGTDGFTLSTNSYINGNSDTFVSWNWKANGAGSANTDGSTNSTVSVNTTSGFSIVKWTGTGSGTTIGHGLGAKPKIIFVKNTSSSRNWVVNVGEIVGADERSLYLNANDTIKDSAAADHGYTYNNTTTTFSTTGGSGGTQNDVNENNSTIIAYCFAEKTGYSKFGKYSGNNNANGPFIYTGFKPSFVMLKSITAGNAQNWFVYDNKRDGYNGSTDGYMLRPLWANSDSSEASVGNYKFDIYSNGFKIRESGNQTNGASNEYIYMAFGQSLVGSNNVPCTGF